MTEIKKFGTNLEAELAKFYLESNNIRCFVQTKESIFQKDTLSSSLFVIDKENIEKASELLERYSQNS